MMRKRFKTALGVVLVLTLAGSGTAWLGFRSPASAQPGVPPDRSVRVGKEPNPPEEKKAEKKKHEMSRTNEMRVLLGKTVDFAGLEGKEIKLGEVLEQLQKIHRITFDINEKAFAKAGAKDEAEAEAVSVLDAKIADPHPIPAMRVPLEVVLRKILLRIHGPSPATYLIRRNHIEITTEKAVRKELGLAEDAPLLPLMTEEFRSETLATALDKLADASGLSVVLDTRADKQGETKVTAALLNVPLDTALWMLTDMAGLEVVPRDNAFYVTTPENAENARKPREAKPLKPEPKPIKKDPKPARKAAPDNPKRIFRSSKPE